MNSEKMDLTPADPFANLANSDAALQLLAGEDAGSAEAQALAQDVQDVGNELLLAEEHAIAGVHAGDEASDGQQAGQETPVEREAPAVDLSRLSHFNEKRDERALRPPRKAKREEKERPKAALFTRVGRASEHLANAFADRRVDGEDGADHINISDKAKTELGRMLYMNSNTPIDHPDLGRFASLGGLWYFIVSDPTDDEFRQLYGAAVRARGSRIKATRQVSGFKEIIAEAAWLRALASPSMRSAMIANQLPYRSYHATGEIGLLQPLPASDWFVPVIEEIDRTLKAIDAQDKRVAEMRRQAQESGQPVEEQAMESLILPSFDFLMPVPRQQRERRDAPRGERGERREHPSHAKKGPRQGNERGRR